MTYEELQENVKGQLIQDLNLHKISVEELMAILYILGQTSTVYELEAFVDIFSDTFPTLKSISLDREETAKTDTEAKVKKVVSKLVQKDPMRATQLAKEALQSGASWDELLKKYPELGEE
jgi:hypothetical protein